MDRDDELWVNVVAVVVVKFGRQCRLVVAMSVM
jgi:hypothetical protein